MTAFLMSILGLTTLCSSVFLATLMLLDSNNYKFSNYKFSGWIATTACGISFLGACGLTYLLNESTGSSLTTTLPFYWFKINNQIINFNFVFDKLTSIMTLMITGIGTLIHLFSIEYMKKDSARTRFFCFLNLFIFFMCLLVTSSNLLVLFIGWEGVGLCSYLLIGFWYKSDDFCQAANKAFIVNRIGDAFFLIAIGLIITYWGSADWYFLTVKEFTAGAGITLASNKIVSITVFCLFMAIAAKSAQFPLFVWLPDAMAGPTPVSALIHAATMVTAGVYLLVRLSMIIVLSPEMVSLIIIMGSVTAFIGAFSALAQSDIKKVLAYSTVSQLGFMVVAVTLNYKSVAIYHVLMHAFFKANLFLAAGSVIHATHHRQDLKSFGGLYCKLPYTCGAFLIGSLSLAGFFPFSGYFSKHQILEIFSHESFTSFLNVNFFCLTLLLISSILTSFYICRVFLLTFCGVPQEEYSIKENGLCILIPLIVLTIGSIFGGLINIDLNQVEPVKHSSKTFLSCIIASWPAFLGSSIAIILYLKGGFQNLYTMSCLGIFSKVSISTFGINRMYDILIIRQYRILSTIFSSVIERLIIQGVISGLVATTIVFGESFRKFQSGVIRYYAWHLFTATSVIILFIFLL
jgi:NADH-quinone oxidoreductase subunit L